MSAQDLEQRARELLAEAFSDAGAFSAADTLLRTAYVTDYKNVVALRAIVSALRQQPAPVVDDAMRENAARYEWLKKKGKFAAEGLVMRDPERWDEAIDHARAQGVQS